MEAHERRTLYGSISANVAGYCLFHHKALTPKQITQHQCICRGCDQLERHEHEMWNQRERTKSRRANRKAELERKYMEAIHAV